jgi:cob(I)alamin adenosyltransferase
MPDTVKKEAQREYIPTRQDINDDYTKLTDGTMTDSKMIRDRDQAAINREAQNYLTAHEKLYILANFDRLSTRNQQTLEAWNADLPALKEFILPGGSRAAAMAHLARTICRRAERSVVRLAQAETVGGQVSMEARRYLNRLSDLLFVAGRVLNRHAGRGDVQWRHRRRKP